MFQSKGFILLALPLLLAACTDSTPKARPLGKFDKKIKAAFREEPAKQLAAPGDWFLKSPDLD
ncbi:MAG TPA: hypothetical protein VM432_08395, partial [Bdellovibrionales bacterium]|nr:hypothetical protein [Bdellovibrionales bacterium]